MGVWKQGLLCLAVMMSSLQALSPSLDDDGNVSAPLGGTERVNMWVYYESLCPFCANFIANHLERKLYDKGLISIVNLRMIPWGNALLSSDNTFLCQHGPDECILNTVEACAISVYPQPVKHLGFISCIERLSLEGKHQNWASCYNATRLEETSPMNCYTSGYGKQLELQFANETARLDPPHTYVPWVVINNQPIREDYENFPSHVCRAYRGVAVPEACRSIPSETVMASNEGSGTVAPSVCYAGDAK